MDGFFPASGLGVGFEKGFQHQDAAPGVFAVAKQRQESGEELFDFLLGHGGQGAGKAVSLDELVNETEVDHHVLLGK